ncbi:MAG: S8 family serine peptidase [Bacteroidales bacterium]
MKKNFTSYLTFLFILFICENIVAQGKYFKMPSNFTADDYMANTIIFKVKPEFRSSCQEKAINSFKANNIFSVIGAYNIKTKFPGKTPPTERINKYGEKLVDLSLIYECKYSSNITLESAINKLYATGMFEYVQPHYLPHLLYVPNDPYADTTLPSYIRQWHLKTIHAYEAWSIQQGDTNIVIGIVDTGTDTSNADLLDNIKINYADPIDGIDNDNDGFIDNYYGYDLADNNYSPQWNYYPNAPHNLGHGVFVSGLAAAKTDNSNAGAGVGFKCRYLPVKIADTNGVLTMAYEGIVYAAEHDCSIINCSWGSEGTDGPYGQDIVNYATNNMNALVVAACGNANDSYPWYPASYDNVLSVAATDINDHKWIDPSGSGSSYGINVGISAPGDSVWSNWITGFIHSSGTSFAAPIVCGAAAIVKAQHPHYSAIQIEDQLKVTADNIDNIPANIPYAGLLGAGRLNMFKALTINNMPSIVMTSNSLKDHNNMSFEGGDTISISGEFKNYLAASSPYLNVTLGTSSPYAMIIDSVSNLGVISPLDSTNNNGQQFVVKILPSVPVSTEIDFKLTFYDQGLGYKAYQYFSIIVNIDYFNIDTNKVATTFTSKGMTGYNLPASYSQGIGFTYYNSPSLLNCGGFLVGISTAQVSDDIYGQVSGMYDTDFKTIKIAHRILPPVVSDFDAVTAFNDSLAGSSRLGVAVTNKAYAWASSPKDKFIIMEYSIKNISATTLSSLYAGLFMDFDISPDGAYDQIDFDATNKMSYTYSTKGGTYAAIKLLSSGQLHHFAFDKDGTSYGTNTPSSICIKYGFSSVDKYTALSTSPNRNEAGFASTTGNDVADMISSGPFILQYPGDSVIVTFAFFQI